MIKEFTNSFLMLGSAHLKEGKEKAHISP